VIALLAASAIYLTGLQATISAPRDAFRACLKQANTKATSDKVAADGFEAYVLNACTAQHDALKSAIIAFNMKNGMAHKAAADDADSTVEDYVSSYVDNYRFLTNYNKPSPQPAPPPPAVPAAAPQPPKKQ
jgi:hypothetical protein